MSSIPSEPQQHPSSIQISEHGLEHHLAVTVRAEQSERQDQTEADVCTICIEDILGDRYTLSCAHVFHRKCIKTSLAYGNHQCPK